MRNILIQSVCLGLMLTMEPVKELALIKIIIVVFMSMGLTFSIYYKIKKRDKKPSQDTNNE